MGGREIYGQAEYLDRAKKLRDTAVQVRDRRVIEALISSAETYERMASWLVEGRQEGPTNESAWASLAAWVTLACHRARDTAPVPRPSQVEPRLF